MTLLYYLSFAVAPLLIFLFVAYLRFKFTIKSLKNIQLAVLVGIISVALLFIANYLIESRWNGQYSNMRRMAFFVFIITAFSSELAKFLFLKVKFYQLKTFTGPLEGIIYSVFINLGFALAAVVLYAYGILGLPDKIHNFSLFLFTYPIASIIFGICMGFFVGMGKLRKNGFIDNSTGLFVSTFFHGLYYFGFITSDIRLLIFTAIGFLVIGITLVVKSVTQRLEQK
ncbi:MAG: PrsW family intramembrane metalloprotease [Bacteroidales bacterium]|jgi:RsiW-degrading membrane proteinase PrsW (M82 family)|nr:PrsW family intramembrane metalloprotease [Bacteroidales bacterium]